MTVAYPSNADDTFCDADITLVECGIIGPPGPPGPPGTAADGAFYHHDQGVASTLWTIVHGLGFRPNVALYDNEAPPVPIDGWVQYIDLNTVTVGFDSAVSGTAELS